MGDYRIDQRNKVKRVPERGYYDEETVFEILDAGKICHASFVVGDQPFVIPTIYGREGNSLYLHGATTSRLIKQLETGVQMSLAVTHLDGLVLARSAFHHSMNYRSVVVFGTAKLVTDEKKLHALKVISDQLVPGRWEESRQPNSKELKATSVLEIKIDQASAKIRTGGPKDDKEDYELDIWAGVVPMVTTYQTVVPDSELRNGIETPSSVLNLIN
ncbi:pyridoxamine 5'-phosphate oxidase family protein [Fulvivirga lutimaris]|uniref:pyridoxamine 5'-phosphate oxidase family protein n=1 Tax=Fulvivirga lutimaris TaxID=1819566 RepID=UPI0012BCCEED|nr:pyridoxamine 5'-phosphate oxidase family protein [Fulvivirga lutimaris]MTI41695.1 pyridoxamine 5'-phosphate oxidase family protein [Fulvivirga lutimaris]